MREGFLDARDFGASGSEYKTVAHATAGSKFFILDDIGDFKVGDEVYLSGCNVHFASTQLFERKDMKVRNRRPWHYTQPLLDRVELRGYDGSEGDWVTYFFDIYPESPDTFRWSKNYGRTWHEDVPLKTGEWTPLGNGVEVKINDFKEREWGATAVFVCSSRLHATIENIEGNTVTLSKSANKSCKTLMMHSDSAAIQRAIDAALTEKKNLFLPNGKYRLTNKLSIINAESFTFEGESAANTVIDFSLGGLDIDDFGGSCFYVKGGNEVTLRNLFMLGNLGYKDRDLGANLFCRGGSSVYGFYFHKTNATCVLSTRRMLIENCHARKMSAECFFSAGVSREAADPPGAYTTELTYLRCSVEDSCRNAFNSCDKSENVSMLYCRVKDVGNAAFEGASRFNKIHGCYIKNAGPIALGNARRRVDWLNKLGTGQHVITDNYFEGCTTDGKFPLIKVGSAASQATISNNIFVNFNSSAIAVFGEGLSGDTPPENVIISGNSIDLTAVGEESRERYGIKITSSFATVADNHIFVRGDMDGRVSGIMLSDDVVRLSVHDNTIAGCKAAIVSEKVLGVVGDVVDGVTFYREEKSITQALKPMLLRVASHRYRGWKLLWLSDNTESEILDFDPIELHFTLKEPRKMTPGDKFYIYGPNALPWSIHHNIIENCENAILIDSFVENRAILDGNIIN